MMRSKVQVANDQGGTDIFKATSDRTITQMTQAVQACSGPGTTVTVEYEEPRFKP